MTGGRCQCGHAEGLHTRWPRCGVALPEFLEEELPPWECPCSGYLELRASAYRWDVGSSSWQAVA